MSRHALMEPEQVGLESSGESVTVAAAPKLRAKRKDSGMLANATILETLDTPVLVSEMLGRIENRGATVLEQAERDFKLSYYFGGLLVAAMECKAGYAIVFSGPPDEVAAGIAELPRAEIEQLTFFTPDPIQLQIAKLPRDVCVTG